MNVDCFASSQGRRLSYMQRRTGDIDCFASRSQRRRWGAIGKDG